MIEFYNITKVFLDAFSDLGHLVVNIMFTDILGYPLIYFAFGAGLATWIVVKITLELIT